jgi:hypothetical protein
MIRSGMREVLPIIVGDGSRSLSPSAIRG